MAECLVHHGVPWEAIDRIVTRNEARKRQTEAVLRELNLSTPVSVIPIMVPLCGAVPRG